MRRTVSEGAAEIVVREAVRVDGVAYARLGAAAAGTPAGGPRETWPLDGDHLLVVEAADAFDHALRDRIDSLARMAEPLLATEREARRDPLTGLANRRAFEETFAAELAARAEDGRELAFVFCDLDEFKRINDRLGYEAGDGVLSEVARVLSAHLRPGERPYRIGGDEFGILLDGGADTATVVAERLAAALAVRRRGPALPSLSTGVAVFPHDGTTSEELRRRADRRLSQAKRGLRAERVAKPLAHTRILVVDDDDALRLLLRTTFERADIVVDEAADVAAARAALDRRPDAIVLDVSLPGIDGVTFLRALRERDSTRELGVVLLTGGELDESAARDAGADVLLRKPFSPLELLAAVERLTGTTSAPARLATASATPRDQLLLYANDLRSLLERERRQRRDLERTYRETLGALASALDSKDLSTGAHSLRVLRYAVELARAVEPQLLDDPSIEYGFLLHDVGKIGIPDSILGKPSALTEDELHVMRTHAALGAGILSRVALLHGEGLAVVRSHHEHWDGSGYPDRLAGEAIPLGARIFAVADALDAMTSDRPYRRARDWNDAVVEIDAQAGRQFDPRVVEAFHATEPELRRIHRELAAA